MLDIIKKSKGKILNLFFKDPEGEYYLREISKKLNKQPGFIQTPLNNLVKEGILLDQRRGNLRFFRLNKNYPLYSEIKKIVSKTIGVEGKLKELVDGFSGIKYAFIFGSIAKETENSLSDIDIILIGEINQDDLIVKITKLEEELSREINYHIYKKEEVIKKLKDQSYFLLNVFSGPILVLKGNINELTRFIRQK